MGLHAAIGVQIIVNEETSRDTQEFLTKRLFAIKNQRSAGDTEELALIIGPSLGKIKVRVC